MEGYRVSPEFPNHDSNRDDSASTHPEEAISPGTGSVHAERKTYNFLRGVLGSDRVVSE